MENEVIASGYKVLKAMGNPNRLRILLALDEKEMNVGELGEMVMLSQSALSQHLAVLRKDSIVKTRRNAQAIFYSINSNLVKDILSVMRNFYD